jgi:WD40 repeat protein
VCDVASGKVLFKLIGHKKPVLRARFLRDGSIVSFSFDSNVCKWTSTGELVASNQMKLSHRADGFAMSRDGKLVAIGDYQGNLSGWNTVDGSKAFAFPSGSKSMIESLAMDPKGKRFVSGDGAGMVRAWNITKKKQEFEINLGLGHHVYGLAWHPDGKSFAAASAPDGLAERGAKSRVVIFAAATGKEIKTFFPDGHQPYCCAIGPEGRLVACAGGGTDRGGNDSKANCVIHVWDTASGDVAATLAGHTGLVRDLAFSPEGHRIYSAGWDDTVRTWELA